jgi:predicted RNA-binding protein YlqC (UPF0109 family)
MEQDQAWLEYVVKALVDNPEDVKIDRQVDEMGVLLTLSVNPADMGKVIGRSGNTAKAIRILLRVVGMKNNARVNLKINEPEGGKLSGSTSSSGQASYGSEMNEESAMRASKSVEEALEDLKL